jgi:hypothetical protein
MSNPKLFVLRRQGKVHNYNLNKAEVTDTKYETRPSRMRNAFPRRHCFCRKSLSALTREYIGKQPMVTRKDLNIDPAQELCFLHLLVPHPLPIGLSGPTGWHSRKRARDTPSFKSYPYQIMHFFFSLDESRKRDLGLWALLPRKLFG